MDYFVWIAFGALDLVMFYGLYAQANDIQFLKNKIRGFEVREARQIREVHVHHHGKAEAPKGNGKAAVIPPHWRGENVNQI